MTGSPKPSTDSDSISRFNALVLGSHPQRALSMLLLLAMALLASRWAATHVVQLPWTHLDGAFQTASGLHRMADGQVPGRDFHVYLGTGLLTTLYALFAWTSHNLAASEYVAYWACATAAGLTLFIVAFLTLNPRRLRLLLAATASAGIMSALVAWHPGWADPLLEPFYPGNSLRPLRGFIPFLAFFAAYPLLQAHGRLKARLLALGSLAGVSVVWSNDFGLPTALAMLALSALVEARRGTSWHRIAAWLAPGALLAPLLLLTLLTRGAALDWFLYNFQDVAQDQWWYFGPWGEEARVSSFWQFLQVFSVDYGPGALVLPLLAIWCLVDRRLENSVLLFIGLALLGGGLLATLGGHRDPGYFASARYWSTLALLALAARSTGLLLGRFLLSASGKAFEPLLRVGQFSAAGILLFTLWQAHQLQKQVEYSHWVMSESPEHTYIDALGGYLHNDWVPHVQQALRHAHDDVLEEYWGLWSAATRQHGAGVDALIHALGSERDAFLARLAQHPPWVITSAYESDGEGLQHWQPWSVGANYEFWAPLFEFYQPERSSPSTVVWQRRATPAPMPEVDCTLGGEALVLSVSEPGDYEVTLRRVDTRDDTMAASRRLRWFAHNGLNHAFDSDGWLALHPTATSQRFAVRLQQAHDARIGLRTLPAGAALPRLAGCEARRLPPLPTDVMPPLEALAP